MSRNDAGRFTNAPPSRRLVEEAIATPTREEEDSREARRYVGGQMWQRTRALPGRSVRHVWDHRVTPTRARSTTLQLPWVEVNHLG